MVSRTIAKHSYDSAVFYIRSKYFGLTPVYAPEASTVTASAGLLEWQKIGRRADRSDHMYSSPKDVVPCIVSSRCTLLLM